MLGHKRVRTENLVIGGVEVELVLWENEKDLLRSPPFSWAWCATLGGNAYGKAFGVAMPFPDPEADVVEMVRQKTVDAAHELISNYWRRRGSDSGEVPPTTKGTVRVAIRCDQCGGLGRLPPREALQGPLCGMCKNGLRIVDGILLDKPSAIPQCKKHGRPINVCPCDG